jgi:hypothetical protein
MRNRRIGTLARTAALLTLCVAAASALSGCGGQGASGRSEQPAEHGADAAAEEPAGGSGRAAAGPLAPDSAADAGASGTAGGAATADVEPNAAGGMADGRRADANGWFAQPPTLRGIAIDDPESEVRLRFGDPEDAYRLLDPPLSVLEYDGFAIGIGENGRVQYVEVSGADVPAGIGDLAVGAEADDALDALGEPDQASDTVLLYRRDGVALKLDFDPNTKRIASILLFAEH